jgi:hypothetical protein
VELRGLNGRSLPLTAVVSIGGKRHWLWRAVDQDGFVLEVLVQSRRDAKVRIPMKPAIDSETRPATHSDFIPASIPI